MGLAVNILLLKANSCSGLTSRKVRAQSFEASPRKLKQAGRAAMKKGINNGKRAHFSVGPYFLKTVFSFAQSTPIRKVGPQSNGTKAQKAMSAVPPKEISLATFF